MSQSVYLTAVCLGQGNHPHAALVLAVSHI